MYGLVNKAIEDFAVAQGGHEAWEAVKHRAEVDEVEFLTMESYPDELTYRLVAAASEVFGLPAAEVLRGFGRHWVLYTGREGYGSLLDNAGRTFPEFLENINKLHTHIRLAMPDLRPPSFSCERQGEGELLVRYWSERDGLAPMVIGLLEGSGALFGLDVDVNHVSRGDDGDPDEFVVSYRQAQSEPRITEA